MESYELLTLRHAKSAWDSGAPSDFQRPLNKRGRKAAANIGAWMVSKISHPDFIISSPALRAWQTAVIVSCEMNIPEQDIIFQKELYLASDKKLLNVLSEFNDDVKKILLIGHNPGLEELLGYLVADNIPTFPDGKILPTATLAHIELSKSWKHIEKGCGTLLQVHRPK